MHLSYEFFLIKSQEAPDIQNLNRLFLSVLEPRGFDRMALSLNSDHNEYGLKSQIAVEHNMGEEWMAYYHEHNLADVDPVLKFGAQTSEAFKWSDVPAHASLNIKQGRFMKLIEKKGLYNGYYIPLWGCNTLASVGLANSQNINGHEINKDFITTIARQYYSMYLRLRKKEKSAQEDPALPLIGLKEREQQIMQLVSRGYKDPEIAKMLGISPHTIDTHFRNIYKKLGAKTRAEAIAITLKQHLMWI